MWCILVVGCCQCVPESVASKPSFRGRWKSTMTPLSTGVWNIGRFQLAGRNACGAADSWKLSSWSQVPGVTSVGVIDAQQLPWDADHAFVPFAAHPTSTGIKANATSVMRKVHRPWNGVTGVSKISADRSSRVESTTENSTESIRAKAMPPNASRIPHPAGIRWCQQPNGRREDGWTNRRGVFHQVPAVLTPKLGGRPIGQTWPARSRQQTRQRNRARQLLESA